MNEGLGFLDGKTKALADNERRRSSRKCVHPQTVSTGRGRGGEGGSQAHGHGAEAGGGAHKRTGRWGLLPRTYTLTRSPVKSPYLFCSFLGPAAKKPVPFSPSRSQRGPQGFVLCFSKVRDLEAIIGDW